ncbi:MAG: hypothetical protein WKF76_07080 [Nocardioidaceae bacterium]
MQQMPVVGAEIQRINDAFHRISLDLSGVLSVIGELDGGSVGTPVCDAAVTTGMTDLRTALSGLQQVASDCVTAMSRHGDFSDGTPAGSGAAGESPVEAGGGGPS